MSATNSTRVWQRALLAFWCFAFLMCLLNVRYMLVSGGETGVTLASSGSPFIARLVVLRDGPAYRAGLRTGDTLDLRTMYFADRYRLKVGPKLAGQRFTLEVQRRGRTLTRSFVTEKRRMPWNFLLVPAASFWILLFAALLVLRRADVREARILALFLIATPATVGLEVFSSPWFALDVLAKLLSLGLFPSFALLALYASLFARPLSASRRVLTWLSYGFSGALCILFLTGFIATLTDVFDPLNPLVFSPYGLISAPWIMSIGTCVFPLLCALAAIQAARGNERTRLLWATCSIGTTLGPLLVTTVLGVWITNYSLAAARFVVVDVSYFLVPLGLTYSLLNRRLLDFGFVLNRAAIFSGVSIIIVGLFVLAEWALSEWMSRASHETNIAISAGLALLLGLSIRFVHAKVEHVVDHVMFRKRREDEEAIRKMAREAPYITDEAPLFERVRQTLLQHAGASFVDVLLDDGHRHFGGVNENDPALVTLRAEHARLDLHATQTAIEGEWAYPMVARGRLVGALVLGPKQSQESYAPDESAAIAQLAHSVAGALDLLNASQNDTVLRELRDLRMVVSTIAARLDGGVTQLDGSHA